MAQRPSSGASASLDKGKKRAYETPSGRVSRAAKRARTGEGSTPLGSVAVVEGTSERVRGDYPELEHAPLPAISEEVQSVPVLQHTYEMQYTKSGADAVSLEEDLLDLITDLELQPSSEPRFIDLGSVSLTPYLGRLVVVSPLLNPSRRWTLLLPSYGDPIDLAWHDMSSPLVQDLMMAAHILQSSGRASISAHLTLVLPPSADASELPFRIQLGTTVSLLAPAIFAPFPRPDRKLKGRTSPVEDAQRRLLTFLFPPAPSSPFFLAPSPSSLTPETANGTTNIPFFYSILRPAPPLRTPAMQELMQPPDLLPTLLPFQRRSVAWLLDREGKCVTPNGDVMPKPPDSLTPFSFWEPIQVHVKEVEEEEVTWYINRLSGLLAPTLPTAPRERYALGGILAEEPGLGKTLESIALILMNPAPPSRNPVDTRRWDEVGGLEVAGVKTTLIVTPPALASQWADELAMHAPSLRVMVYEGWTKVPVPITQAQAEAARLERRKKKHKSSLASKKFSPQTKRKRKRKGKKKFAWDESDWEDEDEDSMDLDFDYDHDLEADDVGGEGEEEEEILPWPAYVHTFDVVITTYSVLRADFNVALAPPVRPRRADVVYSTSYSYGSTGAGAGAGRERVRSPLVMVEWARVIMDEVQMVGGGKTEDMVSLIPRLSSFAVSGTPARREVGDLIHVLKFLRVDSLIPSPRLWTRLTTTGVGAGLFAALFRAFGIRTLKQQVQEELTIPPQTRYLVPIQLGPVEKHVYDQTLEQALQDLGLDARGVAASSGWQIDSTVLRAALRRLRAMCTHPQVGMLHGPGAGGGWGGGGGRAVGELYKPGRVKTIGDVLQNMREANWRTMMDDHRAKVHALIRIAQLQAQDENDPQRFQHALATLQEAEREARALVDEAKGALDRYMAARRRERKGKKALQGPPDEVPAGDVVLEKGKGKQRAVSEETVEYESDVEEDESEDEVEAVKGKRKMGEERGQRKGALRNRLRECRIALHRAKFLQGDMYHSLGAEFAEQENMAYREAEEMRRGLLKGTEEEAMRAMALLTLDATRKHITAQALAIAMPFLDAAGLALISESNTPTKAELAMRPVLHKVTTYKRIRDWLDLVEEAHYIMQDILNNQSSLIWEWRTHMTGLLTQRLTAAEGEDTPDGEEYQRTLDAQGEAEAYLQAYQALLSDRRQALSNERTLLAAHDVREKKGRQTQAALAAAAAEKEGEVEGMEGMEVAEDVELKPEHEVLHAQLSVRRKELLKRLDGRAIKSVLVDLNAAATRIHRDADPEKVALKELVATLRQFMADQNALMDKLDADLMLMRKAFNQRILYFRQLQEISDTVAEVEWEGTVVEALLQSTLEKNDLDAEINKSRARQRYLDNLTRRRDDPEAAKDEDEENCILCRCEFVRGFITQCAHVFCEGCMKAWLTRREGKTCPVCRVPINPDTIERFTVTSDQPEAVKEAQRAAHGEPVPRSRRQISYNMIDPKLFQEIKSMESFGDYGSKIQTLVRHLLYLKITDPGAKSIVFSAWADSLFIMERALKANGIRCLRIDQKSKGESAAKRFNNDPEILVLLLHGERENAGLNVTCASRVFLLESVVHHGFEIQAIARIDRMGQTRPTEVYCYYAEDTVERNILDLAARQGLSLYTKENSAGSLTVASLSAETDKKAVDSPKKKLKVQKGDFIFKMDDMLAILFPHMYEDLEYLIPAEDADMTTPSSGHFRAAQNVGEHANAVAGPSRLPVVS
ncbi:putative SNF2 family N-terminal domain [Lyophyllum shimeji]|uniref:SNF2 family N-terminal domain n=1 Tax=Lyophyllum shimeji TaxID=47721 RepID=A0A9P3PWM2_LYOSH|nr:putative SNF2 family N-terminal domain [Lyophyllum shimeji]